MASMRENKKKTAVRVLILFLVAAMFAAFNLSVWCVLTSRLSNNFSDSKSLGMVDVERYLPHEPDSQLARVNASLKLTDRLPRLDGAAALVPVYASVIDSVYPIGSVTFEGGSFSADNYYGENFAPDSAMQYNNTVRGYRAIVDGDTDIFFSASPSDEQKQYAADAGVELVYVPIGLEAFVFFVNADNPVDALTADEIRGIYSGEYKNWKELGGADRAINPVNRIEGSGSRTMMDAFMKGEDYGKKSPFALIGGSIGFSFRYYLGEMVADSDVKMLSLNGVYPDKENIINGSYPIVTEFYAIYRADNTNENVTALVDWLLSDEGQELIEKSGYIPIE